MQMRALLDRGNGAANILAIFDDGLAAGNVLQRNLVADRNIFQRLEAELLFFAEVMLARDKAIKHF